MRKFMLLFLALLMGLSICAVVINRKFEALATEVRYNETILQGSRSAAEGVELVMNMKTPDNRLLWNNHILLGNKDLTVNSTYRYNSSQQLSVSGTYTTTLTMINSLNSEMQAILQSKVEEVKRNGIKAFEIRPCDYYDYYPIQLLATIKYPQPYQGDTGVVFRPDTKWSENWTNTIKKFNEYFRIPVLDMEKYRIEIDETGDRGTPIGCNPYSFYTKHADAGDRILFCFNNKTTYYHDGKLEVITVDTSRIPEGYGIYQIPYGWVQNERSKEMEFEYEKLSLLYPVDPEFSIIGIRYNEKYNSLYIYTDENGQFVLSDVDAVTGILKHRIVLREEKSEYYPAVLEDEDHLIFFAKDRVVVYDRKDMSVCMDIVNDNDQYLKTAFKYDQSRVKALYKEGKLYVLSATEGKGHFKLLVYDTEKLIYAGNYLAQSYLNSADVYGDIQLIIH